MKKGFTLIELLVVIAIIGILASISMAFLSGSRTKAKDARVISNLKQAKTVVELNRGANGKTLEINDMKMKPDFLKLSQDVCVQQGKTISCLLIGTGKPSGISYLTNSPFNDYCIFAWLPSGISTNSANKAVCMDSGGKVVLNYEGDQPWVYSGGAYRCN
jgi:prepilin-type N-terminal cleavage/methylation domain-containing protein